MFVNIYNPYIYLSGSPNQYCRSCIWVLVLTNRDETT